MKETLERDLAQMAISGVKRDKKARDRIRPGRYEVDELFRLKGVITIGKDVEKTVSSAVPWQQICAVLFSKPNAPTVESVLKDALCEDLDISAISDRAKEAVGKLLKATKSTTRGAVKLSKDFEVKVLR